jgi:IMP dehydrogenase
MVLAKMHEKRVEKALVVDANFHLRGMITVKDFQKAERKPNACKDEHGRLRVVLRLARCRQRRAC